MVLVAPPLAERGLASGRRDVNWVLPYHQFEISSPLRREDAIAAISARVEPVKWFRLRWPSSANDNRFEGKVLGDNFEINRVTGYNNAFLPIVKGEVRSVGAMSLITIRMRPALPILIISGLWAAAVIAFLAVSEGIGLQAAFMLALLYGVFLGLFWFEADKQRKTLRTIFNAAD